MCRLRKNLDRADQRSCQGETGERITRETASSHHGVAATRPTNEVKRLNTSVPTALPHTDETSPTMKIQKTKPEKRINTEHKSADKTLKEPKSETTAELNAVQRTTRTET